MTINVGSTDRLLRLLAGIGLLGFVVWGHGSWRWLGLVGVVMIVTATVRFCPAYALLGWRTTGLR